MEKVKGVLLLDGWTLSLSEMEGEFEAEMRHQRRGEMLRARGAAPDKALRKLVEMFRLQDKQPEVAVLLTNLAAQAEGDNGHRG